MDANASFGEGRSAYVYSCQHFLWVIDDVWIVLCRPFWSKNSKFFLLLQIYCGFFSPCSQRNRPQSWAVTYQPMTSTLLQALETRRPRCMKWSTRLRGNRLEQLRPLEEEGGDTQLLTPVTLLVKQTGTALVCLSWLSVSNLLTFNWLTTDVEEWTLGWPGLGHKCAALQTPHTRPSSYGTREHSMFPSLLFFFLQIFLCWI